MKNEVIYYIIKYEYVRTHVAFVSLLYYPKQKYFYFCMVIAEISNDVYLLKKSNENRMHSLLAYNFTCILKYSICLIYSLYEINKEQLAVKCELPIVIYYNF